MPTVAENKRQWNDSYGWEDSGHEWSVPWGTAADQWHTTILRRIFAVLPTRRILEIAPGFGRWTPYLIGNCKDYVGIDISPRCINHCRGAFGPLPSAPKFILGNGMSLEGVADKSVSLAFSFDSLVHVEMDCLTAYADELARVLEPGGHAFLHHSNLGEYVVDGEPTVPRLGWRGTTVTAERVKEMFHGRGLISLAHEKVQWVFGGAFCDCFTLVRKISVLPERWRGNSDETVFYNHKFAEEVVGARQISERYTKVIAE